MAVSPTAITPTASSTVAEQVSGSVGTAPERSIYLSISIDSSL